MKSPDMLEAVRAVLRANQAAPGLEQVRGNGPFPLSFPQERLWQLREADPESSAYNLSWAFRIQGKLNVAALRESLNELNRRHASLRTVFVHENGRAAQYIRDHQEITPAFTDSRSLPETERETQLRALIDREAGRAFSLETGPLHRAHLVHMREEEHVFIHTAHHIIFDYWSFSVFFRELGELYSTFAAGREPPPIAAKTRYVDFAAGQREQLSRGDALERHLAYWSEHLREEDRPTQAARARGGPAHARRSLMDTAFADELREFAHARGTTLFTVLLTGWIMALGEQDDFRAGDSISIYTPAANRNRRELEDLVGYFINLLVLRTSLTGNPGPGELLNRVHRVVTGGYAHQELPVQFLNHIPGLRPTHTRVMFTFLNTPRSRLELDDLRVMEIEPGLGRAEFDLFPYMYISPRGLECILRYDTSVFQREFADTLLARYGECLNELMACAPHHDSLHDSSSETPEPPRLSPEIREAAADIRKTFSFRGEAPTTARNPSASARELDSLVASILGADAISGHEPLHNYGLNSLAALHIRNRIRSDWNVEISLAHILRGISLNELKSEIAGAKRAKEPLTADAGPAEITDELSAGRKALWFLHERSPNSPAYNIVQGIRARAGGEKEAVFRAASRLVQRRRALRTTYFFREDAPRARVRDFLEFDRIEKDASNWSEARLADYIKEIRERPFDLENGPMLRVVLIKHDDEEWSILLCLHHISLDFESLKLLTRELHALYLSETEGTPEPAMPSDAPGHFTRFQNELLNGAEGERQMACWRERLRDAPMLNLPADFSRPPIQMFRGDWLEFEIPVQSVKAAEKVARENGLTSYMLYLSVFALLLARYSDQRDIVLGGLASGRTRTEFAESADYFVNPLVLRFDLSGNPAVEEVLNRVRETVSAALENQDLPFPVIVERLAPERDLSRTPFFQVLFNQIRMGSESGNWKPFHVPQQEGQFDLNLELHEYDNHARAVFKYSPDLFRASTIARMRDHFLNLLKATVTQLQAPALNLPMMEPEEKREVLARGVPETNDEVHLPAYRRIEQAAREHPDAPALRFAHGEWSYRELNERAEAYRRELKNLDAGTETTVAIALARGPEMIAALLGVHKSGAAYVPLDPNYPPERLEFMLRDSGARVLIIEEDAPLRDSLSREARFALLHPVNRVSENAAASRAENSDRPSNLSHVIYTSGSTGKPKGVAIEQGGVSALVDWALEEYSREELAGVFAATSLCFDLSVFEILVPLCAGGCVIIGASALDLSEHPARETVTLLNTVPSAAAALLRHDALPASLRTVNLAGEPLTAELVDGLYEYGGIRKVYDLYGPSEDTTYSTMALREKNGPVVIGRAIKGGGTYILDREMQPVPAGVPGELYLSGAGLARGYLGRPELTKEKFIANPFAETARLYRTGDLALYTEGGDIRFLGRADQQLKLRGYRIEPGETRAVLENHHAVREAFVLRRGSDAYLSAYVETAAQSDIESELRAYLETKLPEYMRPRFISALSELPRTPNGKVDAAALPSPFASRDPASVGSPGTSMEKSIAALWREALDLDHVGPRENFFDLGGHSLLVLRIRARIQETHGLELPVTDLFQYNTVTALARRLQELMDDPAANASARELPEARRRDHRADLKKKRRALRN